MNAVIVYDHRERRNGVPQRLARLGFELKSLDLGSAGYLLAPRLAVVRKSETALAPWVALGRFERAVDDVRAAHPVVVVVLQPADGAIPDRVRRGVLARLARRGVAVLTAEAADEAAAWIARLARQEQRGPGACAGSLGRKHHDPDRVAENLVAGLPGVSHIGARRRLEHWARCGPGGRKPG